MSAIIIPIIIILLCISSGILGWIVLGIYLFNKTGCNSEEDRNKRDKFFLIATLIIYLLVKHEREKKKQREELVKQRERTPITHHVSGTDKRPLSDQILGIYPKEKTFTDKVLGNNHDIFGNKLVEKKAWYEHENNFVDDFIDDITGNDTDFFGNKKHEKEQSFFEDLLDNHEWDLFGNKRNPPKNKWW